MPASLPSKKVSIVDVPEISELRTVFTYNFFTPDERVNELGSVPSKLLERPSEKFDTKYIETIEFDRSVPRYIEFFWRPVVVGNNWQKTGDGLQFDRSDIARSISIRENLTKIYYEDDFTFDDYTSLHLQDSEVDTQMRFLVEKAFQNMVGERNENKQQSNQERAAALNARSSPEVSSKFITNSISTLSALNIKFFKNNGQHLEEVIDEKMRELKGVRFSLQVNNKLIFDLLATSAVDDTTNPLSNELKTETDKAGIIQESAQKNRDSNAISIDEYDSEITKPVSVYAVDTAGYESVLQTIGYIIEKYEIMPNGSIRPFAPLIIENPIIATTVDLQIKYGARYYYRFRSVAYIEIQAHDLTNNAVVAVGFLVASKPIRTENILCEEFVPPPPPSDFQIRWDYTKNLPCLTWSFPPNPQRDIKYFQIFRRPALNQPFQLIRMFDFDDSTVKLPLPESLIDQSLVERVNSPKNYFFDHEFSKNSSFIYSVCAIDAHGLSSNYSLQFHIAFDRERNKLVKRMVSVAGAPKAYPNLYLNIDTFVDTIKDEGHKQLRVVFNPEYLRVSDNNNNDLGLLKADSLDSYKLQLINVDLQTQQSLTIKLLDRSQSRFLTRSLRRAIDTSIIEWKPAHTRTNAGQRTGSGNHQTPNGNSTFERK